jgi:hypothetical protein
MEFKIHRNKVEELLKGDNYRELFKKKYGVPVKVRVCLHLSFEGFRQHKMEFNNPNWRDHYLLYRMVPPGTLTYFYSIAYSNELEGHKREPQTFVDN